MNSTDLSGATRKLVNILFRKNGLIIIDANNKNFSVKVVLPASGWEIIAKVLRREISLGIFDLFVG